MLRPHPSQTPFPISPIVRPLYDQALADLDAVRLAGAKVVATEALAQSEQEHAGGHQDTVAVLLLLTHIASAKGAHAEAVKHAQRGLAMLPKVPAHTPDTERLRLHLKLVLAGSYRMQGLHSEALHAIHRAVTLARDVFGPEDRDLGLILYEDALVSAGLGHPDTAARHARRALRILEHNDGPDHPGLREVRRHLEAFEDRTDAAR